MPSLPCHAIDTVLLDMDGAMKFVRAMLLQVW